MTTTNDNSHGIPSTMDGLSQKQKILKMMIDVRLANKPMMFIDNGPGNQVIRSGGYLAMFHFDHICSARDVRLRELRREHDVPISAPHIFTDATYSTAAGQRKFDTPVYRLELDPAEILKLDWSRMFSKPMGIFNAEQMRNGSTVTFDADPPIVVNRHTLNVGIGLATKDDPNPPRPNKFDTGDRVTVNSIHHELYGRPGTILFRRMDAQYSVGFKTPRGSIDQVAQIPEHKLIASAEFVMREV
jgi:hypothetical protein